MQTACSLPQILSVYFKNSGRIFTISVLSYSSKRTANYVELKKLCGSFCEVSFY